MKELLIQTNYGSVKQSVYRHRTIYKWSFKNGRYEIIDDSEKGMTLNGVPCNCRNIINDITSQNAEIEKRGFELAATIFKLHWKEDNESEKAKKSSWVEPYLNQKPLTHEEYIHKCLYTPYTPEQQKEREKWLKKQAEEEKYNNIILGVIGIIFLCAIGYVVFIIWYWLIGSFFFDDPIGKYVDSSIPVTLSIAYFLFVIYIFSSIILGLNHK